MEKIIFDKKTFIWKKKMNLLDMKSELLILANNIISNEKNNTDIYPYQFEFNTNFNDDFTVKNKLDYILQDAINECKRKHNVTESLKTNIDVWINVVRSKNPKQKKFFINDSDLRSLYHNHEEMNNNLGKFKPDYTFVYYIQMPEKMEKDDGFLYIQGENKENYWIRPEEDDMIIMPGNLSHAPINAPESTLDRIVFVGTIGFYEPKTKNTLI